MNRAPIRRKPKDAKGTFFRLLKMLGKYKLILLLVMLLSFGGNVLALLGPSIAGQAINEAAAGPGQVNFTRVKQLCLLMLGLYATSSCVSILISLLMMRLSKAFAGRMRQDIFEKLMTLPVGFFDKHQSGDLISRVSYDVDVVSTCLATDITAIMNSLVMVIGSFVMMLVISPPLSVVVLITLPLSIFYTVKMRKRTGPLYSRRSRSYGNMNGIVQELFSGQKTIQAYVYESEAEHRFDMANTEAADAYCAADSLGVTMGPTMGFINNLSLALIAATGSLLYMLGFSSLGQISSFILYSRRFAGPINEIANVINEIFSALSAAERVFNLLDETQEAPDAQNAVDLIDPKGHVEVENVSFSYEKGKTILHNLSLKADAGKLIAIVGPTGSGKTTIINLLMRFYDPDSGSIIVDEKDIRTYSRKTLRDAWAMVLQQTWVFNGTIYDNIAYGKENATRDQVIAAAKAAHIHPFIMRLPQGYDTVISEDGGNISKGQKQLLTIARAMLYDAKMLILDEATSNVDTHTERQIQAAMRKLMHDKTCFVIAHRLSTIRNADRILMVDHGDVIEAGTHQELMKKKGAYYKLYTAQFE